MSNRISDILVPAHGPDDARIMCVGESPGEEEEELGYPFVGTSGFLMSRYFERNGVTRKVERFRGVGVSDIFTTNICPYRPAANKFVNLLGSEKLRAGVQQLREDIERVDPTVILAFGGWPLFYLTSMCGTKNNKPNPGSGITLYRGSVLPNTLVPEGPKVLASYHPAYVGRNWTLNPILNFDIGKCVEQSKFPEIREPQYEVLINPTNIEELTQEACASEWVSWDIETFGPGEMSCFGFCVDETRAVVLTFQQPGIYSYARRIVESPCGMIAQYGTYDHNFVEYFFDWKTKGARFDTYVAMGHIEPSFPKGLAFLCSVYTDFPYYKEERKIWKQNMDLDMLWSYNAKDVIATWQIAHQQMKELEDLYGVRNQYGRV